MWLTVRSVLSRDGLFGIQRQSATIWGSLASRCWPAHSSCRRTRGVCWSSREDRQEEGWCQVMTCLGCFSRTIRPVECLTLWIQVWIRLHVTSDRPWQRFICLNGTHVHQTSWVLPENLSVLQWNSRFPQCLDTLHEILAYEWGPKL